MRGDRLLLTFIVIVLTWPLTGCEENKNRENTVTYTNHPGGVVEWHANRVLHFRKNGTLVQLKGRCASSCTMFLALPYDQRCLFPGTVLAFHKPHSAPIEKLGKLEALMMKHYPSWVHRWLDQWGGLTKDFKNMPYSYAKRFVKVCE